MNGQGAWANCWRAVSNSELDLTYPFYGQRFVLATSALWNQTILGLGSSRPPALRSGGRVP